MRLHKFLSLIFLISSEYSDERFVFSEQYPQILMDGHSIPNGFRGGLNKPRVQWIDHDRDGDTDLFLLDMDGYLRYYENQGDSNEHNFVLITAHFQNVKKTGWFAFRDFDMDLDLDLVTQNIEIMAGSYAGIRYYVNEDGHFNIWRDSLLTNTGDILLCDNQSTPTFVDIDNDGDEDFFSGNQDGTLSFYKNVGMVNGNPIFEFITDYWQSISIIGQRIEIDLNLHGASAITFIDLDGDSDFDLSWGDYFQESIYIIWNIGSPEIPEMDIENIENQFPSFEPIQTGGQNMPTFADLDGDGDQDLFVTVLSGAYGTQYDHNFIQYLNIGSGSNPIYEFETDDFFNSLDIYSGAVIDHTDIDSDGDLDMFIGTEIDYSTTPFRGKIQYFNNEGSLNNPIWVLKDRDFLGTNLGYNLAPCFGDLDNDGDSDLLLGDYNGKIFYYERTGEIPDESSYIYIDELNNIDLSGRSHPELCDIDGDGDLDLFIGENMGNIHFYENLGNEEVFEFSFVSDFYFDIDVGNYSSPEFLDIDNDTDPDLFVGSQEGNIIFYRNIGTNLNPDFQYDETMEIPFLGGSATMSIGDFFNSGRSDMIAGLFTGGLYYLKEETNEHLWMDPVQLLPKSFHFISAYPNPFNAITNIQFTLSNIANVNMSIYDINGEMVKALMNHKLSPGNHKMKWIADEFSSGIYFVSLMVDEERKIQKVILVK